MGFTVTEKCRLCMAHAKSCRSPDSPGIRLGRMISANYTLINPLNLYVAYAPIRDLPATFLYCFPVTILEWNSGHAFVLPPVFRPDSIFFNFHYYAPIEIYPAPESGAC